MASAASSSCPMDLTYVETIPWNTSVCKDPIDKDSCCTTLLSIFAIGLAELLKDTSTFYLPHEDTSSTCLSEFKLRLEALSIQPNMVYLCFPDPTRFVFNSSGCAGIRTVQDWKQKVGMVTPVDKTCNGDLKDNTRCSICFDAATKLTSQLKSIDPNANATKCFHYVVLYAAGVANPFGTTDLSTTGCILGLLGLSSAVTKGSSSNRGKVMKLVFTLLGAVIGVVLASVLMVVYRKWDERRKQNAHHREIENNVRASVLPNTGAKWFHISELEHGTSKFSESNVIGRGGDGLCTKGLFRMALWLQLRNF
ncbi:receptor protein kinase [Spatholobus suberectus]|nr:receptor protein kinase [Spatholobus suberectus]